MTDQEQDGEENGISRLMEIAGIYADYDRDRKELHSLINGDILHDAGLETSSSLLRNVDGAVLSLYEELTSLVRKLPEFAANPGGVHVEMKAQWSALAPDEGDAAIGSVSVFRLIIDDEERESGEGRIRTACRLRLNDDGAFTMHVTRPTVI